ncbi:spore coat protein [Alteribacter aurantiacus]|uniref:spore coat protein n=1 Tax=Alteribacter aurantiacus TaxID=254410 RepID=UPI0003FE305A|nr:spore coat protein [Alteribacter aurantiacus]
MDNYSEVEHLAWHETLEIHELVAFQSVALMRLKKAFPKVANSELKSIYREAIEGISKNLQELLEYYPMAPIPHRTEEHRLDETSFYAGDLLGLFKTSVRNYGIAITETATPSLRAVLKAQLNNAIDMRAKIYSFMYQRSDYPSYNLEALLQGDVEKANAALNKRY